MVSVRIRVPAPNKACKERDVPIKFNLMNTAVGITAALAMVAAVIGFDSRYLTDSDLDVAKIEFMAETDKRYTIAADLETTKNEIINELRQEVSKNRAVMIASMQRTADDIEFQMMEHEQDGTKVPRFLIEKHKQIIRQIEDLQEVDRD